MQSLSNQLMQPTFGAGGLTYPSSLSAALQVQTGLPTSNMLGSGLAAANLLNPAMQASSSLGGTGLPANMQAMHATNASYASSLGLASGQCLSGLGDSSATLVPILLAQNQSQSQMPYGVATATGTANPNPTSNASAGAPHTLQHSIANALHLQHSLSNNLPLAISVSMPGQQGGPQNPLLASLNNAAATQQLVFNLQQAQAQAHTQAQAQAQAQAQQSQMQQALLMQQAQQLLQPQNSHLNPNALELALSNPNLLKRGPEIGKSSFVNYSGTANESSNGQSGSHSPSQVDFAETVKKAKLDQVSLGSGSAGMPLGETNRNPSKVLHIRNVPTDATERDMAQLGIPFGKMTALVLAKRKNQALLELEDVSRASAAVNYYQQRPPSVKGRSLIVQFSKHLELKPKQTNDAAQHALNWANNFVAAAAASAEDAKSVLRVMVDALLVPINVDTLHQVFAKFGTVLKIVIFSKNNVFQALVQMETPTEAQVARLALNGQNIYPGCCTMRIDFSKLNSLNVRFNNDKSKDYTEAGANNPPGPPGTLGVPVPLPGADPESLAASIDPTLLATALSAIAAPAALNPLASANLTFAGLGAPSAQAPTLLAPAAMNAGGSLSPLPNMTSLAGLANMNSLGALHPGMALAQLNLSAPLVSTISGMPLPSGLSNAPLASQIGLGAQERSPLPGQNLSHSQGQLQLQGQFSERGLVSGSGSQENGSDLVPSAGQFGEGSPNLGANVGLSSGQPGNQINQYVALAAAAQSLRIASAITAANGSNNLSSVVLVSNLNEEKVSPDALFTLFGVYGDVLRVKIMYNKKDSALIQFADGLQAQLAMLYLNGVKLWDKPLKLTVSKHTNVQMPKEGQPDSGLTKDYSKSPLHRFKNPNSKNFQHVFPPNSVLHVSNIPLEINEEQMASMFAQKQFKVLGLKFFQSVKEKKMALVQLPSIEDAVHGLIELHNAQVDDSHNLRITFSKPLTL